MAYSLYTDRNENFECDVSAKNADLKHAQARLVVKTEDVNLMFEGTIHNGRCVIPICKMKGLLAENTRGEMQLEIIVDDTYFSPWKDNFVVEEHTSVKVQVHEQKRTKPLLETTQPKQLVDNKNKIVSPEYQLYYLFEKFGIHKKNIEALRGDVQQIIREYFKESPELIKNSKKYVRKALALLK